MKKAVIFILVVTLSAAAGGGLGWVLSPEPEPVSESAAPAERDPNAPTAGHEYVQLSNQFIVPIIKDSRLRAHVVVAVSVEVLQGQRTRVLEVEPVLRDAFLQEILAFASTGGFDGAFSLTANLETLRVALEEAAVAATGDLVTNVLITDIGRQDAR